MEGSTQAPMTPALTNSTQSTTMAGGDDQKKAAAILAKLRQPMFEERPIARQDLEWMLDRVCQIFKSQPMLVETEAPISICGDMHGQFQDLLRLFDMNGMPPGTRYLFLGDYVDRGPLNFETITWLFTLKVQSPNDFFLLRGNHETRSINRTYGFMDEIVARYDEALYERFNSVFEWMPLSGLISKRILCMHGGISPHLTHLDQIRQLPRPFAEVPDHGLVTDLLWADPDAHVTGFALNTRGISYVFGADVVIDMCELLDLDLIARAHQVVHAGFEFFADDRLVTLFSAPDYCNMFTNAGGILCIDPDLSCRIRQVPSRRRPG